MGTEHARLFRPVLYSLNSVFSDTWTRVVHFECNHCIRPASRGRGISLPKKARWAMRSTRCIVANIACTFSSVDADCLNAAIAYAQRAEVVGYLCLRRQGGPCALLNVQFTSANIACTFSSVDAH